LTSNRSLLNLRWIGSHCCRIVIWTHNGWSSVANVLSIRWSFLASRIVHWTVRSVRLSLTCSNTSVISIRRTIQILSHLSSWNYRIVNWSCRRISWLSAWISWHWRSLSCSTAVYRGRLLLILGILIRGRVISWTIGHRCKWLHSICGASSIKTFHSHIWDIWR
jgi:hypothetical protein